MEIYENKKYYTCGEIAFGMNQDLPEFQEVKKKFCELYRKPETNFFYQQYIQTKLHTGGDKKLLNYLEYQKQNGKIKCRAYALDDILAFLEKPEARKIGSKVTEKRLVVAS